MLEARAHPHYSLQQISVPTSKQNKTKNLQLSTQDQITQGLKLILIMQTLFTWENVTSNNNIVVMNFQFPY